MAAFVKPYASERPYQEYAVPSGSLLHVEGRSTGYIEAVTNERFSLGVTLPENFHSITNAAVRVTFTLHISDAERIKISQVISVVGLGTRSFTFEVDTFIGAYPGCAGYTEYGFRFVDRDCGISPDEETKDITTRSRIDVDIVCGQLKPERLPGPITLLDRVWETPTNEMLAVDLGRSHTVDLIDLGEIKNLPLAHGMIVTEDRTSPATHFTFYYVSHEFLKKEHIIPCNQPRSQSTENANIQLSIHNFLDQFKRQPKRKASKIDCCDIEQDDDEGPPPQVGIKTEADEDNRDMLLSEPLSTHSMREDSPTTSTHTLSKVEDRYPSPVASMAHRALQHNPSIAIRREKANRRAMLRLELEELENKAAQIKIKKRLLELEDGHGE